MIQRIKTWLIIYLKERKKKKALKIIKKAKQAYLNNESFFMCCCFYKVASFKCYNDIVKLIPEFKPSTFGFKIKDVECSWWSYKDRESRIKAFDKLIEIYSK